MKACSFLRGFLWWTVAVWGFGAVGVAAPDETCTFQSKPQEIREGRTLTKIWEVVASDILASPDFRRDSHWLGFEHWIRKHVNPDQDSLLQRQIELTPFPEIRARMERVRAGSFGHVRKIACLEYLLHQEALKGVNYRRGWGEFLAFVLVRSQQNGQHMRIYFTSENEMSVSATEAMKRGLETSRAEGWTLAAVGHNHPFYFDNRDIAGTVVPSEGDLASYSHWASAERLVGGWITNGFDTWEVMASELPVSP